MTKLSQLFLSTSVLLLADSSSLVTVVPQGQIGSPGSVALGANGAIYIGEHARVWKVQGGVTTLVAGTGDAGFQGDGGPATAAWLNSAGGMAVDSAGNLYIADTGNSRIRKVNSSTGIITTIAGNGVSWPHSGDGGPALQAVVVEPRNIAVEPSTGAIYINDGWASIRRIDQATGIITNVAGSYAGSNTTPDGYPPLYVNFPQQMTFDATGSLVFAERLRVRRIDRVTNLLGTLAGPRFDLTPGYQPTPDDGALAVDTYIGDAPIGMAFAADGALYVGQETRIRRVDPLTKRTMTVTAPAGACTVPASGVPASTVPVCPSGLAMNPAGELIVAHGGVSKISFNRVASSVFLSASPNPSNQGQGVTIAASVSPAASTGRVFFYDGAAETGSVVPVNGTAAISTSALLPGPHSLMAVYEGSLDAHASQSAVLNHKVRASTATAVSSTPATSVFGATIQLTASVTPAAAAGAVEFWDGATLLGAGQLSGGAAALGVTGLAAGSHSLAARYAGNADYVPSNSAAMAHTVSAAALTVSLTSSLNPSTVGAAVAIAATLSRAGATGGVQFFDGGTFLGTVIAVNGQAAYSTNALTLGSHSFTASYTGDQNFTGATSPALTQTVNKAPTATTIASSSNPAVKNQAVTFTVTVAPSSAAGSVQILDGTAVIATKTLANGTAAHTVSNLAVGTHAITAKYLGDANDLASQSGALSQAINRK